MATSKHPGSCHCGAVKYEVEFDLDAPASRCNCSICSRLGATTSVVKPDAFRLLAGEDSLTRYEWGGRTAQRYFCKVCGITCFLRGYLDVLGGDYVSFVVNTLDDVDPNALKVQHWDGRHNNWMAGARDTPWPIFAS
jgi:hypothetical protein